MRPLPCSPDFPVVKWANLSSAKHHSLELWNFLPATTTGDQLLEYVTLGVREQTSPPELLISSRPHREDVTAAKQRDLSTLAPVGSLGLLALRPTDIDDLGRDRELLVDALARGDDPWEITDIKIDGQQESFRSLLWTSGWLAVGHQASGTTVSIMGRVGKPTDINLVEMPEHELRQL